MTIMTFEKIDKVVESILDNLHISALPVPIEDIASNQGIKISRAPSKDFSGLLIRKDGHALIGVNSDEPDARQRFTIAHELGHFFLHPRKDAFVDYRDNKNKKEVMRTPQEKQANVFAASLLMPRKYLEKDFKKLTENGFGEDELKMLAERYFVSEDAMRFRLFNLNLRNI